MISPLVESIENYVFLEHIVERIELKHVHDKSTFVSVLCSNGSSWEANRGCIVTIPLSMLKEGSITFSETPSCIAKLVQAPIE